MTPEELTRQTRDELKALMDSKQKYVLELDAVGALGVCGAFQLALRHPKFKETRTAQVITKMVESFTEGFKGNPAVQETIRRGWQRKYDERE